MSELLKLLLYKTASPPPPPDILGQLKKEKLGGKDSVKGTKSPTFNKVSDLLQIC